MENSEKRSIEVKTEDITANLIEGSEIIVRKGEAEKPFERVAVKIHGTIDAPFEWLEKRKGIFDADLNLKLRTHVLVDLDKGCVILVVEEHDKLATTISGTIEVFDLIEALGINTHKSFSPKTLLKIIKMKSMYFQDGEKHQTIMENLINFEALVESKTQSVNDFKGTKGESLFREVKTKHDYGFLLHAPIFKGGEKKTFKVEVEFEPTDAGTISCWCISTDLAILMEEEKQGLVARTRKAFTDFPVIIQ